LDLNGIVIHSKGNRGGGGGINYLATQQKAGKESCGFSKTEKT